MKAEKPDKPVQANGNGKTAQSYIAGIGASGALLAGAVVTFVFLVGAVSFEVWPTGAGQRDDDSLGVAELSGPGSASSAASLGEAVTQLAAAVPDEVVAPKVSNGLNGGGGSDESAGGGSDPVSTVAPVEGSDGSTADVDDDPSSGDGGSGRPSNGNGNGTNRPDRDTGNTGSGGGGSSTPPATGTTGGSGGGSGSGGSGGGGSNHSSR